MGMLETIQSGRENRPPRIMIYGSEGVGKIDLRSLRTVPNVHPD